MAFGLATLSSLTVADVGQQIETAKIETCSARTSNTLMQAAFLNMWRGLSFPHRASTGCGAKKDLLVRSRAVPTVRALRENK